MSGLDDVKKGSPNHKVKLLSGGAFQIFPIGNSEDDLARFQPIAEETISLAASEGRYCLPHPVNRHPVDHYDLVVVGEG